MIGFTGQAALAFGAIGDPIGRNDVHRILGQRQRFIVNGPSGGAAYQMRIGRPIRVGDNGSVESQYGIETPPIAGHHVRNGCPYAAKETRLAGIESTRRGHAAQLDAVQYPLLDHRYHIVEVQIHGQLLLGVVAGTYQMRDLVGKEKLRLCAAVLKQALALQKNKNKRFIYLVSNQSTLEMSKI